MWGKQFQLRYSMVGSEETIFSQERDLVPVVGNVMYTSAHCSDTVKQVNRTVGISRKGAFKKILNSVEEKRIMPLLIPSRYAFKALKQGLVF